MGDVDTIMSLGERNKTLEAEVGRATSLAARWQAAAKRRIKQHEENLAIWAEPDGWLVPTEPDPEERARVRRELTVAIEELRRLGAEIGVVL